MSENLREQFSTRRRQKRTTALLTLSQHIFDFFLQIRQLRVDILIACLILHILLYSVLEHTKYRSGEEEREKKGDENKWDGNKIKRYWYTSGANWANLNPNRLANTALYKDKSMHGPPYLRYRTQQIWAWQPHADYISEEGRWCNDEIRKPLFLLFLTDGCNISYRVPLSRSSINYNPPPVIYSHVLLYLSCFLARSAVDISRPSFSKIHWLQQTSPAICILCIHEVHRTQY